MRSMLLITVASAATLFAEDARDAGVQNAKIDRTSSLSPIKEKSPAYTSSRNSSFVSYKIDSSKTVSYTHLTLPTILRV